MVIAIDGYEANVPNRVGIGRYAFEILRHIYTLKAKHFFRIYLPSAPLPDMPKETSWWKYVIASPKKLWTFIALPRRLFVDKPDVIFSPTHYIPRFINIPQVMAIMDLSYVRYPQMFRGQDLHKLTQWTAYGVRNAKKILTISEFSKNDIIRTYNVLKGKVIVTYPGISKFKMQNAKLKLPKEYILSVGTIQPRKNFVRLVEAFSRVIPKYPGLKLVIVGKRGWLYDETLEAPKKFGVENNVRFLHDVSDGELATLYKHAKCFVLPSLYEGFGFPVLEAMSHTCPVVVSNVSSLPEIAGDAGIYVNPESVESITQGIIQALTENQENRIRKGLIQTKKFSWGKAAKQTLKVLEEVAKI